MSYSAPFPSNHNDAKELQQQIGLAYTYITSMFTSDDEKTLVYNSELIMTILSALMMYVQANCQVRGQVKKRICISVLKKIVMDNVKNNVDVLFLMKFIDGPGALAIDASVNFARHKLDLKASSSCCCW